MSKIPVKNTTAMPIYVHGVMIPGGETRHFDKGNVPSQYWPKDADVAVDVLGQEDPLKALSEVSIPALKEALPGLSLEDLERLGDLEQQKGEFARKGALAAIVEEQLDRAARAHNAELKAKMGDLSAAEQDAVIASLPMLTEEELVCLDGIERDLGDAARHPVLDAITTQLEQIREGKGQ